MRTPGRWLGYRGRLMDAFAEVRTWPQPAAVVVADSARLLAVEGPDDRYAFASVTKLLTALTVLDAAQRGLVDLDEPAGPPAATVRHLLAHASGVSFDGDLVVAPPGRRRVYSNRGFEILAELVSTRAGLDFADVLEERVCRPLGLAGVTLEGSAAAGARGTVHDLALLGQELLRPTLLPVDVVRQATSVAFPGLVGVLPGFGRQDPNDWGLGFEIRGAKSPHWTGSRNSARTFGHFGQAGSFLWVDPDAGLACACLSGRAFGPWAGRSWPRLSDAVLDAFGAGG